MAGLPGVNYVAVNPVGTMVALGYPPIPPQTGMAGLFLYDIAGKRELGYLRAHTQAVYQTIFSPDGKTVATASWDGTARLWHAATGEEMLVFRRPVPVLWTVAFSPNNHFLAVGGGYAAESELTLWDARPLPDRP